MKREQLPRGQPATQGGRRVAAEGAALLSTVTCVMRPKTRKEETAGLKTGTASTETMTRTKEATKEAVEQARKGRARERTVRTEDRAGESRGKEERAKRPKTKNP